MSIYKAYRHLIKESDDSPGLLTDEQAATIKQQLDIKKKEMNELLDNIIIKYKNNRFIRSFYSNLVYYVTENTEDTRIGLIRYSCAHSPEAIDNYEKNEKVTSEEAEMMRGFVTNVCAHIMTELLINNDIDGLFYFSKQTKTPLSSMTEFGVPEETLDILNMSDV